MSNEFIVGAFSLAFACVLLGLRQLLVGRKNSRRVFIVRPERGGGDSRPDDSPLDWPTEIAVKFKPAHASKFSAEGAKSAPRSRLISAVALLFLFGAFDQAHAQQTVFNVPTTDVLDKGKVYFELDVSAKPNDDEVLSRFSSFVPRVVVGVGHNVEVGLNVPGNVQPGPDATTLVPTIKWRFYNGGDNGWAMVAGAHLHVPVRNRAYSVGNYSYLMTQKSFKTGTRVGFGGYFFSRDVVAAGANRAGGQLTFEQPVTKKLNWNTDWFTGKHAAGYLTTGAAYKLSKKLTGLTAYSIGNRNPSKGNHFFYFELGYNFN